ncbi:MAG: hypothetical protein AAF799_11745 [Myxococcota bacterium]
MSRLSSIGTLLVLTALAVACPRPAEQPQEQPPGGDGASVPGGAVDPGDPAGSPGDGGDATACLSDSDCDGGVCEGQGCGDDTPGTCAPAERMCTRDAQTYCGCDGKEFTSSGSCPGRRFASRGKCEGEPPTGGGKADGESCLAASECAGGVCEGEGCGDDTPGTCASNSRMCTRDYRAYCGCDGTTFHGSGSCPGQRYAKRGEC